MKLPNVIHVGYSKAMSAWLQRLFNENQEIFYVRKTNYFIPYFDNYQKGIEYYQKYFFEADKYKVVLESDEHLLMPGLHRGIWINTTNLDLVTKTMTRIQETLSEVKVILVIRNQVDMIISKYVQYVRGGGKLSVDSFLDEILYKGNNYLKYCDYRYSEVIQILWKIFTKNNVYIIILEEFKRNQEKVLNEISDFIGTKIRVRKENRKKVNVSPSYYCLRLEMILNKLFVKKKRTINQREITRIPLRLWAYSHRFLELIDAFVFKQKRREKFIGPFHEAKIQKIFHEDNKKLELLLRRDLRSMGYY